MDTTLQQATQMNSRLKEYLTALCKINNTVNVYDAQFEFQEPKEYIVFNILLISCDTTDRPKSNEFKKNETLKSFEYKEQNTVKIFLDFIGENHAQNSKLFKEALKTDESYILGNTLKIGVLNVGPTTFLKENLTATRITGQRIELALSVVETLNIDSKIIKEFNLTLTKETK